MLKLMLHVYYYNAFKMLITLFSANVNLALIVFCLPVWMKYVLACITESIACGSLLNVFKSTPRDTSNICQKDRKKEKVHEFEL